MNPVKYSAANQALVDAFDLRVPAEKTNAYWSDPAIDPLRKEIKDHYISEQDRRCCYCKVEIPTGNNAVWDGEHIISRHSAPHFMFEPRNLCVSCKDCNQPKAEQEVRTNPKRKSFPDQSGHYRIVHAHFDKYDEHIRWYGKVVRPLTDKGIATSIMCNLQRFSKNAIGVEQVPHHPAFALNVGVLMDPRADSVSMQMALAAIQEYLKTVPQA